MPAAYHQIKVALASPVMLVALEKVGRKTPCGQFYEVTTAELSKLPIATRQPAQTWPAWAILAALFALPEDRGVGDTIARELGEKTEAFKRHHEAIFGIMAKPCSCSGKIERWNFEYSYQ